MSFWGKLGKGLLMAAPFVPIPGMQAIGPLAGTLLKGGIGAATGAIAGGKKGALVGGTLGGVLNSPLGGKIGSEIGQRLPVGGSNTNYIDDAVNGVAGSGGQSSSKFGGLLGGLGKVFGKGGIDPTTALLGGMSLLGGNNGAPEPFTGSVDPQHLLEQAMGSIQKGRPEHTRMKMPEPIPFQANGMPLQIGGGLGLDPALRTSQQGSPAGSPQDPYAPPSSGTGLSSQMKSQRRKPGSGSEQA